MIPGKLLSFTLEVPWHFPGVTTVEINFTADKAGNCQMDFQQAGVDPSVIRESWKKMFAQLKTILDKA
jgi:hypothetical protein